MYCAGPGTVLHTWIMDVIIVEDMQGFVSTSAITANSYVLDMKIYRVI